jgi:alkanesulfonate monooxygenase SsuD/methylene tetrahydromethanopterin reductase-like flavin-dependent oxidoreductase (luciferase family)
MFTTMAPRILVDVARETEAAGWDGFFIWDGFVSDNAWVLLAATAMATKRIRIGTMLTALSRRRPWQLAGEVATLDRLSNGRAILSLGLGAADDLGFARVGEATDRKVRAELLDEGIELVTRFWSGQPFTFDGTHYHVDWDARHSYTPVQQPRIPIWVVGAWPSGKSMRRVLRCDGLIPSKDDTGRHRVRGHTRRHPRHEAVCG